MRCIFHARPFRIPRGGAGPAGQAWKHLGLYVYRRDFLLRLTALEPTPLEQIEALEQLRVLEHGFRLKTEETRHNPIGVDTPADLARVREIMERLDGGPLGSLGCDAINRSDA